MLNDYKQRVLEEMSRSSPSLVDTTFNLRVTPPHKPLSVVLFTSFQ